MRKTNNNMENLLNDSNGRSDSIGFEELEISDTAANTSRFSKFIRKHKMNLKKSNKYIYLLLFTLLLFFVGLFVSREVFLQRDIDKIIEITKHLGPSISDLHLKEHQEKQQQFEAKKQMDSAKEQIEKAKQEIAQLENELKEKDAIIDSQRKQIKIKNSIYGKDNINNSEINSMDASPVLNKTLSDIDEARSNVSTLKDKNIVLMKEMKKNLTIMVQDLEMLKEEFPQVKIKMYLPYMNQYPNDSTIYICAINGCKQQLLRNDLITHLMDSHATEVAVNTDLLRKISSTGRWDEAYLLVQGELFRVASHLQSDNRIWFFTTIYGPDELAADYGYEVELLPPIRARKSLYASGDCSNATAEVPVYLKIESHRASAYVRNHTVQFKVKIVKKIK